MMRRKPGPVFQGPKPFSEKQPELDEDFGALRKIMKEGLWFNVADLGGQPVHSFQNLRIVLKCSEQELLRAVNQELRGNLSSLPMDDERIYFAIQHASEKGMVELKEDKVVPFDPRKPKLG